MFLWSNSATTEDITGLSAGSYGVTVTDANACIATLLSAPIVAPTQLTLTFTQVNNVCKSGTDGSATANPTGGTAPFTYSWSEGTTTQTLSNLAAGTYSVTVTDSKGCTIDGAVTITEPATEIELFAGTVDASACGGATGEISLTVVNGTLPFTYTWTGPTNIGNIGKADGG